jgi:hypothetical protein
MIEHILLTDQEGITSWLDSKDIFTVDDGFRDCLPFLNNLNYDAYMPDFLDRKEKQSETSIAKHNRQVTSVRRIVDFVNDRVEQWKMIDKIISSTMLPRISH